MDIIAALHQQLNDSLENLSKAQACFQETERQLKARENEFRVSNQEIEQRVQDVKDVGRRINDLHVKYNESLLIRKELEMEVDILNDRLNFIPKKTQIDTRAYIGDTNAVMTKMLRMEHDILVENNCYIEKCRDVIHEMDEYKRLRTSTNDISKMITTAVAAELINLGKQIAEEEADIRALEAEKLVKLKEKTFADQTAQKAVQMFPPPLKAPLLQYRYARKDQPPSYFGGYRKYDWRNNKPETNAPPERSGSHDVSKRSDENIPSDRNTASARSSSNVVNHQKKRGEKTTSTGGKDGFNNATFVYDDIDSIDE